MNNFNFLSKTPKEIDKLIAARIRNIRRRRKISQKRLKVKYRGADQGMCVCASQTIFEVIYGF